MPEFFTTRIVHLDPQALSPEAVNDAATLIREGQLVAFPTETVYGLGGNALDEKAVSKIFAAKGRPATDPLIVHIESWDRLTEVALEIPRIADDLVEKFWPGPLTMVLPRQSRVAPGVSAGLPTVAVRMPAHPIALALIKAAGVPIAAPSANRFAHSSPTTAQHVLDDLSGRIPLILDGGPTQIGLESTIVDLSGPRPRLLRPGGVPLEALVQLIPDLEVVTRYAKVEDGPVIAPGMLLKHYAPRAEFNLFEGNDDDVRAALAEEALRLRAEGKRVGLLIAEEDRVPLRAKLGDAPITMIAVGSLADLDSVAHGLFAALRALDDSDVDVILSRGYPPLGLGLAIGDRLVRAAEGRVNHVGRT